MFYVTTNWFYAMLRSMYNHNLAKVLNLRKVVIGTRNININNFLFLHSALGRKVVLHPHRLFFHLCQAI